MAAVPKTYKTKNGTELPLINLRGKPYLQVAHRLVWLTEEYSNYTITTDFIQLTDEYAIARSAVNVYDENGTLVRTATATKKETKKDFPDFVEKAETGSIGRALAMIGLGTQFCTQDLDEGDRLADAPIPVAKKSTAEVAKKVADAPKKVGSFNKNKKEASANDGWS